jgi:uncharacterized protein YfaS (alpha-2-macroglobulin family)
MDYFSPGLIKNKNRLLNIRKTLYLWGLKIQTKISIDKNMKMKRASFFIPVLLPLILSITLSSCKKNKDIVPSVEYTPYVSAYTGGIISSNSSIQLELTQEQEIVEIGSEIKEKLFSFSPSLKGKTYWINNKMLEFVPDSGELKSGTFYDASFALKKVVKVDKKLAKFNFSFRVEERTFVVSIFAPSVSATAIDKVNISGEIRFSNPPKPSDVSQMISAKRKNESFQSLVEPTDNPHVYHFRVADIDKKAEDTALEIEVSGKAIHVDKTVKETALIPALKPFKLLSAEIITTPEYGIQLIFSSPVSDTQDINGIITLNGVASYVSLVQENKINLFFERRKNTQTLDVYVDQGLKSISGEPLAQSSSISLQLNSLAPNVEILSSGTIMPNSKTLILPFRAVSLYAVDMKIIRVFENNILMFLQNNTLSSSSELRRSGRLIYKKMIRLDSDPTKRLHEWENYSIDLSDIIKQEPGAIYRVELTFKQNYAAYPCGEDHAPDQLQASNQLITVASHDLIESEDALWDVPEPYFYYNDAEWDWDLYNWEERDNPCHATYYMTSERKAVANVLASDLGLIVKSNSNNQLWIAVSNLLDTKPVANADVTVYNFQLQPIGSSRTDENGFAMINTAKNKPFVIVASSNSQKAYLRLTDGGENMLSRFDVGGKEIKKGLKGYIYGERGVWRPGDTLHISFMLEDRERKIPDTHPVSIEIYNPQGQFYQKQMSSNGLNGLHAFAIPTQADDPTGLWNAYVKVGGTSFHKSLRIEMVKPNRLKINLNIPGDKLVVTDGVVPITLQSVWLTGATAHDLKTKVEMSLSKTVTQFKGYEKYLFNNPATDFESSRFDIYEGALNEQGQAAFQLKVPTAKDAPGVLRASISCSVFEQGGDASTYNQTIPFYPFPTYVGINFNQKPSEYYFETDVENTFDVVTLNAEGKPVNSSDLEYKIYRIGWSWWWGYDDKSYASYLQNSSIQPVASGQLHTVNGKAQIKFQINYPDWGSYLVYVKDREGGHACGGTVYMDWPDWRGRSNKSNPDDIKMLAFSTDKVTYEAGEKATVTIPAAAGGRVLVAIENASEVISREWVEIPASGDAKYTFTVTESMAPNIYVHISLLQPHEQTVNDLPIRMYGVMPIFVTNKNSILTPQIIMPDVLRPETEFTVKVKEANKKAMTYTLAIVDDGLLDLTNFKTPDPWNEFYAREALGIRTWDLYDDVIGSFAGKYGSIFGVGGDEDGKPSNTKANRFKPIVKFIGPFALKKGEEKSHQLQLPPYVGSVRVMVVAGQDDAYGKAEKTVPVRTPLMVLSSLPRVVSTGEEIVFPVNIFAMEDEVKNVSVKVETTGKLQLVDGQPQAVKFSAPGDQMVYFSLTSGDQTGVEKITVTATGNGHTSKETIEIDVRNPNPPIISAESKLINSGESGDFTYHLDGDYDGNWVKLEVSRIPSVDISRRFDFLYNYQHYCSEQITSRALPLLFISQFKEMNDAEGEMVKKNVREAITNLYGRQQSNGSFVYWPNARYGNDWISSYAGIFLVLAKEKGYDVNAGILSRWENYQQRIAREWRSNYHDRNHHYYYDQTDLNQAYRLYSLALAGVPEMGAMNRMKEIKDLSEQAKWRLAAAYALAGKINIANELVFNAKTEVDPYSLNNSTYGSYSRDEAMILETLVLMGKDKEAFLLAQKVSRNLSSEYSFTTQSTAYALIAMGRMAEKVSGTLNFNWTLNEQDQPVIKSAKAVFQKDLPLKPASGSVIIKNTGEKTLYVNLVSKTKPLRDSLPSVESNIRLEVSYTQLNGAPVDVTRLKQGTDFVAVIKVSNVSGIHDYTDLALTQIIPSGWEIHNERMINPEDNDTNNGYLYTYQDIRDDRLLTYFDLDKGRFKVFKIRLMAAYAGSFVFPAIQCEAMYDTEVQARTKAGRVVVEK